MVDHDKWRFPGVGGIAVWHPASVLCQAQATKRHKMHGNRDHPINQAQGILGERGIVVAQAPAAESGS
jgi:hypothetical protein